MPDVGGGFSLYVLYYKDVCLCPKEWHVTIILRWFDICIQVSQYFQTYTVSNLNIQVGPTVSINVMYSADNQAA